VARTQTQTTLARDDFCDLPRDQTWLPSLAGLCGLVALFGDAPRARLLYRLLLPYADRCVIAGVFLGAGSVSRPLGQLATILGRYDDAERHFEQALEMNTHLRSPLSIGHTQHDYARMLLLRNDPGDNDQALQLLTEALTTAEALGLTALANNARPLKLTAEAATPPPALPKPV
jgi:tetratricopeptide (TPR) repeat protein